MDKLNGSVELAAKLRQIESELDKAFNCKAASYDMQAINWAHKELSQINERINQDIINDHYGKLKKLAERLGYEIGRITGDKLVVYGSLIGADPRDKFEYVFEPLTNNDQFVEIMEWLVKDNGFVFWHSMNQYKFVSLALGGGKTAKTPQEAALNAALALIGDEYDNS